MRTARLRLRIRDKATNATYAGVYPWEDGYALCWVTGTHRPLMVGKSGYTRYNDRGEPETDSWREPPFRVVFCN